MSDKPREEKSYKSLYPDLSSSKKLNIINPILNEQKERILIHEKIFKEKKKSKSLNSIQYSASQQDNSFINAYLNNNKDFECEYKCIAVNLYELIMDRILKEWRLWQIKVINQYYKNCYKEKIKQQCVICTSEKEGEGNLILVCNGCGLQVHQECYGVPNLEKFTSIQEAIKEFYFLDSLWFCRKCLFFKDKVPKCKYCNIDGNAYKQIQNTKRWGHVLCVKFIETLNFSNSVFLEPIEELKCEETKFQVKTAVHGKIVVKEVAHKTCFICNYKKGGVIKCANKACELHYHVTCGINSLYYFDLKNEISYCYIHDPEIVKSEDHFFKSDLIGLNTNDNYVSLKHVPEIRKRVPIFVQDQTIIHKIAHMRPRFSDFIANRIICSDLCMLNDRLITNYVIEVGMFWNVRNNRYFEVEDIFSLDSYDWLKWDDKRTVICIPLDLNDKKRNRKSIQTENIDIKQTLANIKHVYGNEKNQIERNRKIQMLFEGILVNKCSNIHIKTYGTDLHEELRTSLNNAKDIFLTLRKKEILEQEMINLKRETINYMMNDGWKIICILKELENKEAFIVFENPVTEKIAPGYFSIIKNPMCFKQIKTKISEFKYTIESFKADIQLIVDNCRLYNARCEYFISLSNNLENTVDALVRKYNDSKFSSKQIEKLLYVFAK